MSKPKPADVLLWIDMEMTGLEPERDRVLELASVLTDSELRVIAEGPELVVHQSEEILAGMDEWNTTHHGKSGLTARVRASTTTEAEADAQMVAFLAAHVGPGKDAKDRPVLAGNSIHQDRRFVVRYLPKLDARLHYRLVDVSTIKELARRWYPGVSAARPKKKESHRAKDDILESIEELRFYRQRLFVAPPTPAD